MAARCSGKTVVLLTFLIGLCCGMLWMSSGDTQYFTGMTGTTSMATRASQMTMMRPSMQTPMIVPLRTPQIMHGCPIARRSPVARAATVKMGADDGSLVFVPDKLTIKAGETVEFVNNAGFPHNVVFDDEQGVGVPPGVNPDAISQYKYLNAKDQKFELKFDKPGDYTYYCETHFGDGMKGKVVVK